MHTAELKPVEITALASIDEQAYIEDAIEELHTAADLFHPDHSGTWAKGILHGSEFDDPKHGWLIWDMDKPRDEEAAIAAFKTMQHLPDGYHRLNKVVATKIVHQGILRHGIGFVDGTADAAMRDAVLQTVVLGQVTYA